MSEGVALKERRSRANRNCQHRWVIETPHGKTSRGLCRRCGATKRFPNAAADALGAQGGLGRWANRRGVAKPKQISFTDAERDA
jgi:hypothetical protein